ncbi:TrfB-related DNA-binding protein [Budvicia aquatica]|uniref:TrfB transcriptional repressor protein domain-containing protein n=1 Tax=Budvicia aquatica TaxID=82979 RepID=A0A2C6C1C8_9GAMM|nr:TrfB-related DNA-binding protein [Budvicia aquatica]PHI30150.1 hypothetical protein CRN84_12750 [Budvicia aquatica]VFS49168.1 Uncharacterised protein [Budvicia aquatica]
MTQDEFNVMKTKLSQFSLRTVAIAEAVLVEGLTQSEAAIKYQASKQSVCGIMKRVASAIEDVPNDWKKVEVWLPAALAVHVLALADEAKRLHLEIKTDTMSLISHCGSDIT